MENEAEQAMRSGNVVHLCAQQLVPCTAAAETAHHIPANLAASNSNPCRRFCEAAFENA